MAETSIGDLCELFDPTPRAIRDYEERGLVRPARDRKYDRTFSQDARERLGSRCSASQASPSMRSRSFWMMRVCPGPAGSIAPSKPRARPLRRDLARTGEVLATLRSRTMGEPRGPSRRSQVEGWGAFDPRLRGEA